MAIEKKLIHFKNRSTFNDRLNNNEILPYSIVFIADTHEIYTHGNFFGNVTNVSEVENMISSYALPLSGGTMTGEIKFNISDLIYKDISAGIITAFKAPRVQINELISNYIYLGSASEGSSSDSPLVIRKYSSITDKSPSGTTDLVTIDTSGNVTAIGGFTGNLTGTATQATQDGNGNNIVNTYATKNELNRNSKDGVFIMFHRKSDNHPLMVKPDKWASYQNGGEIADGVVVVEGGRILVVAPTETSLYWSSAAVSAGGKTTGDRQTALYDFEGKSNTTKQIIHNECSGESYAPGYCARYSRVNANGNGLTAGHWWLPSLGELMMIYANMRKVNYALSLIEGATQLDEMWYWSSTELNTTHAWCLYLDGGYAGGTTKSAYKGRVRPVSAFYNTENTIRKPWDDILSSPDLSEFTSELTNVASATKATQDGNGNVIADTYATKGEVPTDYLGFENVGIEVEDSVEYLTTSQQSLSDDEKERVKSNIGVNVPIVEHGTSNSTFALTPNKYHRWGTMSSLTLTLASPNDTSVVNNYAFEFTSGGTATTLLVPSSIQWVNDITVEAGKRYQGIVNNGVGVLVSVSNE